MVAHMPYIIHVPHLCRIVELNYLHAHLSAREYALGQLTHSRTLVARSLGDNVYLPNIRIWLKS